MIKGAGFITSEIFNSLERSNSKFDPDFALTDEEAPVKIHGCLSCIIVYLVSHTWCVWRPRRLHETELRLKWCNLSPSRSPGEAGLMKGLISWPQWIDWSWIGVNWLDKKAVWTQLVWINFQVLYLLARDSAFLQTIYIYIYIAKVGLTFLHIKTKISSIASITEKNEKSTEIPISHQ